MIPGGTIQERTQLNIETLWSGGKFDDPYYNGGNKEITQLAGTAQIMQSIRETIFLSPTADIDNIENLTTPAGAYGSYAGAGYLFSNVNASGTISKYSRWLDLDQGLVRTAWKQGGNSYLRTTFCSHSSQACVEHISSPTSSFFSSASALPGLSYTFSSSPELGLPIPNITCLDSNTLSVRGRVTLSPTSMIYEFLFRVSVPSSLRSFVQCVPLPPDLGGTPNATINVVGGKTSEAWVTWVGGSDYSIDAGDDAHNFTFRGDDPHTNLLSLLSSATSSSYQNSFGDHISSYNALLNDPFSLSLGQSPLLSVSSRLPSHHFLPPP
jgi:alpha-L-fucosidase 2